MILKRIWIIIAIQNNVKNIAAHNNELNKHFIDNKKVK